MQNTVISFDVGTANLAYWIGTLDDQDQFKTLHWELVDTKSHGTIAMACYRIMDALDTRSAIFNFNCYIVIENQPDSNPKMKTISHIIQAWFYMHGVPEKNIKFVSPRNKLNVYTKPLDNEVSYLMDSYRYRKDLSVAHTRAMMAENNEQRWLDFLNTHTKKDDLADAYLQGCHSLRRFQTIDQKNARRLAKTNKIVPKGKCQNTIAQCVVTEDDVKPADS